MCKYKNALVEKNQLYFKEELLFLKKKAIVLTLHFICRVTKLSAKASYL